MIKQIKVTWIDSRSYDRWTEEKDIDLSADKITTLGYLVKENDEVLCVAASKDKGSDSWAGIMIIPKVCVSTIQEIKTQHEWVHT